jgi:Flp pilus assembly pilin Flp
MGARGPFAHAQRSDSHMTRRIHAVGRSQRGQGISEYVVMLALIVMLVAGTVHLVAANAKNALSKAASALQHRSDSD